MNKHTNDASDDASVPVSKRELHDEEEHRVVNDDEHGSYTDVDLDDDDAARDADDVTHSNAPDEGKGLV
ncbi:MAG TPA: hypothetical protein VGP24_13175 [Glaciihabitans sp.]|jgi:hypothetical protein|nr:hypothetical protein [Glaciihabitans sp.]